MAGSHKKYYNVHAHPHHLTPAPVFTTPEKAAFPGVEEAARGHKSGLCRAQCGSKGAGSPITISCYHQLPHATHSRTRPRPPLYPPAQTLPPTIPSVFSLLTFSTVSSLHEEIPPQVIFLYGGHSSRRRRRV